VPEDVIVADTVARVLSILSLGIVAVGAFVAVMTYRPDRARLALRWSVYFSRREQQLEVIAVNDGRQPLVVEEVAIQNSARRWPRPPRKYPGPLRLARAEHERQDQEANASRVSRASVTPDNERLGAH
jgi:hypothetical protein